MEENVAIIKSSEYCRSLISQFGAKQALPLDELTPGYSFCVPGDMVQEHSLRALISAQGKAKDKKYKCLKHKALNIFEIAEVDVEQKANFQLVEQSPEMKLEAAKLPKIVDYQFKNIPEGKSVIYRMNEVDEKDLRMSCHIYCKKYKIKLAIYPHKEYGIFEVGRIVNKKETMEFFEQSNEMKGILDENNMETT